MKKLVSDYLLYLRADHTPATVESYKWALKPFQNWIEQNCFLLKNLTVDDVCKYFFWLESRSLKMGTRSHYGLALRGLFAWLAKRGEISFRVEDVPKPERDNIEPHAFCDISEYKKILDSFDEFFPLELRNKTIVSFLFTTGIRLGELMSINVGDLNFDDRFAQVKTFKRKNHIRAVYWPEYVNDLLQKWLHVREILLEKHRMDSEALFIALDSRSFGARVRRHVVQRIFRKKRNDCGIEKKISPHSMRHGFATYAMQNNINLRNLQELMGHANIRTTSRYLGVRRDDVERDYRTIFDRFDKPEVAVDRPQRQEFFED